jgi:hypothetical protein
MYEGDRTEHINGDKRSRNACEDAGGESNAAKEFDERYERRRDRGEWNAHACESGCNTRQTELKELLRAMRRKYDSDNDAYEKQRPVDSIVR